MSVSMKHKEVIGGKIALGLLCLVTAVCFLYTAAFAGNASVPVSMSGTGTAAVEESVIAGEEASAAVEEALQSLTLEDKVWQLFIILPESLTGTGTVTEAGDRTRQSFLQTPVGGLIYMRDNLNSREQIRELLANTQAFSLERVGLPAFLCVDEEGGPVRRINGRGITEDPEIPSMREVGGTGDQAYALSLGRQMGESLNSLGFNVNFAPVADVLTNSDNVVVRERSFGSDPETVARLSAAVAGGLEDCGVSACMKHFPGHGSTSEDSHEGYAVSYQTKEELLKEDLVPFQRGIREGVDFIMTGHISLPNVTGEMTPASMNHTIVTELLREEMGYEGLIITDALNMGAITDHYSSGEAAVTALEAGNDMLLMPSDYRAAFDGIMAALREGTLTEDRIDASVRRILQRKTELLRRMPPA